MQTGATYRATLRWRREPVRSPRLNGVRQLGAQPDGMPSGAEDWPSAIRDRLRLAYLDVLGRLSGLHFADGRYATCADVCGRIIECDSCREDAHRRLMLCYSRQGQSHLALIQYRACVQALARELGVGPDPATAALYERIRRHERV